VANDKLIPDVYRDNWDKARTDPNLFTKVYVSPPEEEYYLFEHQLDFIQQVESGKYDELYMSGGNSAGKTWSAKFLATHMAAYKIKPGKPWKSYKEYQTTPYSILCTGPENKQAVELWESIERAFRDSPFLRYRVESVTVGTRRDAHPVIKLKNGVTIDAIGLHDKGKHIEGEAYDLVLINEPADARHLIHCLDKVLHPRTWRRGGIVCGFGTPKGKNEYWTLFRQGLKVVGGVPNQHFRDNVYSVFADSRMNPKANQEKITKFLKGKNKQLIDERVMGLFIDEDAMAFPESNIELCTDETIILPIKPSTNREYLTGVDFGRKQDFTVSITLDVSTLPFTLVNFYKKGGGVGSWEEIMSDINIISKRYGGDFVVDATAMAGDMQTEWLKELGIPFIPYSFSGTGSKKVKLINNLQDMLAKGEIRMPFIPPLYEELRQYPRNMDDKLIDTDCVMALALAGIGAKEYGNMGDIEDYRR